MLGDLNGQISTLQADIASAEETLSTLTPSPDAERRAQIEAALAEKRPALEGVNNDITATTADYDGRIAAAQAQKAELEGQLAQYEATYDASLAAIDAQLTPLLERCV